MQLDVEALLAPVSEDAPSGEDLTYDDARQAVDEAFELVLHDEFDGEEPEWRPLVSDILGMLKRCKDVWFGVYLCRAGARLGDLELVQGGAEVLAGLLERWETVYPALDDLGPQGRKSPCDGLGQRRAFLAALEAIPLVSDSRNGRFAVGDLERFANEGEAADGYIAFSRIMEADGPDQLKAALAGLEAAEASFRRVDAAFSAHAPVGAQPDFAPLFQSLRRMRKAAAAHLPEESKPASAAGEDAAETAAPRSPAAGLSAPGQIGSREDVLKALDAICAYYARHEPTSPVPLALKRARSWVTLDFFSLLTDIAPDSLNDARRVLGQSERSQDEA
jgi:type VI secretion system protein ImpA